MALDQSKRVSEVAELLALGALHFDKPSDDEKLPNYATGEKY